VTGARVVGAEVIGGASSTRTGDCTAASALDETTPEQPEIVNEIRPIDTTTNARACCVWLKYRVTVNVTVVSIFNQLVDSPCIWDLSQLYCSGNSNQMVRPYLMPAVSGKV